MRRASVLIALLSLSGVTEGGAFFDERAFLSEEAPIAIVDDGVLLQTAVPFGLPIEEALREVGFRLKESDVLYPQRGTVAYPGMSVIIDRSYAVTVAADGKKVERELLGATVSEALLEAGVSLAEDDIVRPAPDTSLGERMNIAITRVRTEEVAVDKPIKFEKKVIEDEDLSFLTKKIEQKGENGNERTTYRVSYHDGKEVARKLLRKERTKEPVSEIERQGTRVKLGKKHTGMGTWYAWTGTLAAASPWLPMGSYAKVTNQNNGKSVIVKINDRGPFGPNRIIDLDKVAFAKIASIGAGIIPVAVEEVIQ